MTVFGVVSDAVGTWCAPYEADPFVVVPTYHVYPSNSCVQIFIEGGRDTFVVSDGGGALKAARSLGTGNLDLQKHLRAAARNGSAQVSPQGWIYAADVNAGSLTSVISVIAECSSAAAEAASKHFRPIPVMKADFRREVEAQLRVIFPKRVEKRVRVLGSSNKMHKFDFGVRLSNDRMIVMDAVTHDANSINAAIVSHLDLRNAHIPNISQRLVYDDRTEWQSADLSLLQVGATAVGYTHVKPVLESLAA